MSRHVCCLVALLHLNLAAFGMSDEDSLKSATQDKSRDLTQPVIARDLEFEEVDGLVAVEAEDFFDQSLIDTRAWFRSSAEATPDVLPDGDGPHYVGASGGSYLEVLPDTRRTHDDRLINGENFSPKAGEMAVLSYRVHFNTPGRYYVWARTHSTGTEDNGLHVGIDGTWPESGQRMQWTAKNQWFWDSKQRTQENHSGEPGKLYLDIEEPGEHVINFSMREDGFEFDKWLMTTEAGFARPENEGPAPKFRMPKSPASFRR